MRIFTNMLRFSRLVLLFKFNVFISLSSFFSVQTTYKTDELGVNTFIRHYIEVGWLPNLTHIDISLSPLFSVQTTCERKRDGKYIFHRHYIEVGWLPNLTHIDMSGSQLSGA